MSTVRWGIVGLGAIAHGVAGDFQFVPGAELAAVASRTQEKAQEFAARHGVKHAYGSYRELLESPEVDVVYIATPHNAHSTICTRNNRTPAPGTSACPPSDHQG